MCNVKMGRKIVPSSDLEVGHDLHSAGEAGVLRAELLRARRPEGEQVGEARPREYLNPSGFQCGTNLQTIMLR